MKQLPKAVTFDCFGTLIDWEGEIQKYIANVFEKNGIKNADPKEVHHRWEEIQFEYIDGGYKPYRKVLHDTLAMTFEEYGFKYTEDDCSRFADSMGSWKAFPDSHDALVELKKYCKIVLITNTDNSIIKESVKQLDVEFDDIVTAEMAGAYKPSHKGFDLARKRLGLEKGEILHAGFGFKYDVVPATELGYETCWINRQGEVRPVDVKETYLVGDMKTFVYMIKGMAQTFAEQK
jgi:2-haloalkanoic acid dehalogenase type II